MKIMQSGHPDQFMNIFRITYFIKEHRNQINVFNDIEQIFNSNISDICTKSGFHQSHNQHPRDNAGLKLQPANISRGGDTTCADFIPG